MTSALSPIEPLPLIPRPLGDRFNPDRAQSVVLPAAELRRIFLWLLAGDVMFMVCEQIESKILPVILKRSEATDTQISIIVGSIAATTQLVVSPILGYYSDRTRSPWGRRVPYIFWSAPFLFVTLALTPWAPDLARLLGGWGLVRAAASHLGLSVVILTFGGLAVLYRTSQAIISPMFFALFREAVPWSHMGRFMALFRIVGSLSTFIVSFWLIGLAATQSRIIFFVAACLNLVVFTGVCWKVREPRSGEEPAPVCGPIPALPIRVARGVREFVAESFTSRLYWWTFITRSLVYGGVPISGFMIFFPVYELGLSLRQAGMILSAPTAIWILVGYPIGRRMETLGAAPILSVGLATAAGGYFLSYLLVMGPLTFLVSTMVTGLAFWVIMMSQLQLAQEVFPIRRYSQLSGASLIMQSLTVALLVAPLSGWVLDSLKGSPVTLHLPGGGTFHGGAYRFVNVLIGTVYLGAWVALRKLGRVRREHAHAVAAAAAAI